MSNKKVALEFESLMNQKKIPILTLDQRWHELFPLEMKTSNIRYLEEQVNYWLKRQGQVNNNLKEIKEIKSRLIEGIVANMETVSSQDDSQRNKRMEKSQKLIQEANDRMIELEDEKISIPYKLLEANKELMLAGVEECYEELSRNEEEADEIGKWISEIRMELKEKLIIKQEIEEKNTLIYSNLHDILGPEVMRIIDRKSEND